MTRGEGQLPDHRNAWRVIGGAGVFFLALALLSLFPVLTVYLDIVIFSNGMGEISFTELSQSLLLSMTILLYGRMAWKVEQQRGFFILVTGFFSCMLIREQDAFFDLIAHGAWLFPALFVAGIALTWALLFCRATIVMPMAAFVGSHAYYLLLFGLVLVLVFSRVFGSGSLLWGAMMGEGYFPLLKNVVQEGLELLGYGYLLVSGFLLRPVPSRN